MLQTQLFHEQEKQMYRTQIQYSTKKQELMYWISTRTYVPDSIIP
jgi:hypothetical protein